MRGIHCRAYLNRTEKERRANAVRLSVGARARSRKHYEAHPDCCRLAVALTLSAAPS